MRLESVKHIPDTMEPGVLYVSQEYGTASHLCACGCGHETVTPLGPGEWALTDGPTLRPSIGQRICKAHYWIRDGEVVWC